jgi:hypothetical protein
MKLEQQTPGPWHWVTEHCDRGFSRGKQVNRFLCGPAQGQIILSASWNTDQGEVWQAWVACRPADSPLILAAPLLRDALLKAMPILSEHCGDVFMESIRAALDASKFHALAQAEPEEAPRKEARHD